MNELSLPPIPEGITPEWLTQRLRANGTLADNTSIVSLKREPVGEGVAMMSSLSRLIPTYDKGATGIAPVSFIAKYPAKNPTNREIATAYNFYEREVRYFAELAPLTTARCPATFVAQIDGDDFIILMEDMGDYDVGNQAIGATLAQTELALDELAKLHATFWDKTSSIDWIPHVSNSFHATNMQTLVPMGWDNMLSNFAPLFPDRFHDMKDDFLSSIPALQAHTDRPPITLAHGDFRMENLLFGTEPEHQPLAIVDWQGLLGRGMQDVTLFMGQSTQTDVRRKHERTLLQHYVNKLESQGVAGYGFDEAWDDYRHTHLHNWAYTSVVAGTLDVSNENTLIWMSEMIARQVATTEDLGLLDLLPFDG
ncbi:MAG: phosphotransferase [Pseudomonadales bacterium]|nr:phosphotransferase [Pseudomonadales bacterium]